MKVMFRFKPYVVNKPGNKAWIGFAEGRTWEDIIDVIDEFGDPTSADIVKISASHPMGFCIPYVYDSDDSNDSGEQGWCSVDEEREISNWFFKYDIDSPEWETKRVLLEELEEGFEW